MEEDIEGLKRLFYANSLTQYGKRKLINYYEQRNKKLEEENKELQTVVDSIRYLNNGLRADKEALTNLVNELQKQIRNSIPTSVIQEKIDWYKVYEGTVLCEKYNYREIISVLQKILEKGGIVNE